MRIKILIVTMLCLSVFAYADEDVKGAHPYDVEQNKNVAPEFAHWSIIPHFGFSSFDGDFTSEMKHSVAIPSIGIGGEYAFTPIWGIGVEYMYDMYTVTGKPGAHNADTLLNGHMHKLGAYISMDLVNIFFPHAEKKIVSVHPYVGGGAAFYKRSKYYKDDDLRTKTVGGQVVLIPDNTHKRGNTQNYINEDGVNGPERDKSYRSIGYLQAGVNVEFNLNRSFALGVRANYSYFTRDYVDGRGYHKLSTSSYASKNNDGIFDITLNARYKIDAVDKTHLRNISGFDIVRDQEKAKELDNKLDSALAAIGKDTVIIYHDTIIREYHEGGTSTNTYHETIIENEQYYYVYFDNNKDIIKPEGLITIQQVADRMNEDPELYAVVTGSCDNTGSDKLNYGLGDRRANNVLEELREEHGISSEHLYSMGVGKLVGRRSTGAYGPNRRASIRLVDKATFDRMKSDLEDKRANRPVEEQTVPLTESARPAKQPNVYQTRNSGDVVTDKNTTLSKLARQYYNNTYCWVYIYIANKDKIKNPNALTPGISLSIPELTEKEMHITKDEGLVLYYNARQSK